MYIVKNCSKYITAAILAAVLILSGCSKKQTENKADTVKITATFYPLYIMCLNITAGIPDVELSMLAPPQTGCLHDYMLTTKDMQAITSCDILVANGAGMETFLDKAVDMKKGSLITAAEGYALIDKNPHVWVSPKGALYEVKKIAEGLESLDVKHKTLYEANAGIYFARLAELSEKMHTELFPYEGSCIITFHEAFPYFASDFGLKLASVVEREPGTVPSAKELDSIITQIKEIQKNGKHICLYAEPQYSSSSADIIAKETGLTVYELDPCVTGEMTADAYINAQEKNLAVLEKSLSGNGAE